MVHPLTYFLRKTVFQNKINAIKESTKLYNSNISPKKIIEIQIKKFNFLWKKIQIEHSFYKLWMHENKLPKKISTINEISDFPSLTKKIINERHKLIIPNDTSYRTTYTGGTSGVTTIFPTNDIESFNAYVASYTGRQWWGVYPLSKIVMLWGHSHLFENGIKGQYQHFKRKIKDFIINTNRISSYELSETNLVIFFNIINKLTPSTIISYSGNIFRLAKFMHENNLKFKFGKIEKVIVTSETLYTNDIILIKKILAENVINEYGMAETGVIGYSKNSTQNINIFWNNFILTKNSNDNLFITTLTERVFPLINYDSEDKVKTMLIKDNSILKIKEILGKTRNNLPIKLINGITVDVSTIFFDHVLKYLPNIYSVQYLIKKDVVYIILNVSENVNINYIYKICIKKITENFGIPDITKIIIKSDSSTKTIAGKHSTFIK